MRIAVSADHAGVDLKDLIAGWLREQGHDVLDLGTNSHESVDYPKYGAMLADALADGRAERGITVCGSGIGVAIAGTTAGLLLQLLRTEPGSEDAAEPTATVGAAYDGRTGMAVVVGRF